MRVWDLYYNQITIRHTRIIRVYAARGDNYTSTRMRGLSRTVPVLHELFAIRVLYAYYTRLRSAGRQLYEYAHEGPVTNIAFHPSELLMISGSSDRTVRITGVCIYIYIYIYI